MHAFRGLLEATTPTAPKNFQNLNLLPKYKTYEMCETFRGQWPKTIQGDQSRRRERLKKSKRHGMWHRCGLANQTQREQYFIPFMSHFISVMWHDIHDSL